MSSVTETTTSSLGKQGETDLLALSATQKFWQKLRWVLVNALTAEVDLGRNYRFAGRSLTVSALSNTF
jgi:hypothetical protein